MNDASDIPRGRAGSTSVGPLAEPPVPLDASFFPLLPPPSLSRDDLPPVGRFWLYAYIKKG